MKKNRKHDIKKLTVIGVVAGLSIIGLLIREAIAYANIAGMPARSGFKKTNAKSRESENRHFKKVATF